MLVLDYNMTNSSDNTSKAELTWTRFDDLLVIIAGLVLLILVSVPTLIMLIMDLGLSHKICHCWFRKNTESYWIWDTISLHCRDGLTYYMLSFVCAYCALYLTMVKTIEFNSHTNNGPLNTIILVTNLFSYLFLLGAGIIETHPHPDKLSRRIKSYFHIGCAAVFFILNITVNLFWSYVCIRDPWHTNNHLFLVHNILTYLALMFFVLLIATSIVHIWFLSIWSPIDRWKNLGGVRGFIVNRLVLSENKIEKKYWCVLNRSSKTAEVATQTFDELEGSGVSPSVTIGLSTSSSGLSTDEPNISVEPNAVVTYSTTNRQLSQGSDSGETVPLLTSQNAHPSSSKWCNCLLRRRIFWLCALNYWLELCLIVAIITATLLQIAIEIPLMGLGNIKIDNKSHKIFQCGNYTVSH